MSRASSSWTSSRGRRNHDGVAFVVREAAVADRPSASPLRLALRPGGADSIEIHVVKRRGPPLLAPLTLKLPPVLSPAAGRRSSSAALIRPAAAESRIPSS
ncbi:MAG: hypothetical protein M3082_06195 [Candidatus Dormibacteraeota bacterium]|nr:hypothetical protein [Candidatus Dormibacteraeota bacterium]